MTASSRGSSGCKRQSERDRRDRNKQAFLKKHVSIITTSPHGRVSSVTGGIFVYSFNMYATHFCDNTT